MAEETQIQLRDVDLLNPEVSFDNKLTLATNIANKLADVIETQKLYTIINDKKYVHVDGWALLGTILGCTPHVEEVIELPTKGPNFMYQATVSIQYNGNELSRAVSIAERNNKQRERFAVHSMSQTRATGKAFRLALSFIMNLAGYESTPFEEMIVTNQKPTVRDLKERKEQRQKEKEAKMESEPVEAEVVEPRHKPRTTPTPKPNTDLKVDDPEPLRTIVNQIIRILRNEGREPIRKNIWIKATECCKDGRIKTELKDDLQEFIMSHCPEEL